MVVPRFYVSKHNMSQETGGCQNETINAKYLTAPMQAIRYIINTEVKKQWYKNQRGYQYSLISLSYNYVMRTLALLKQFENGAGLSVTWTNGSIHPKTWFPVQVSIPLAEGNCWEKTVTKATELSSISGKGKCPGWRILFPGCPSLCLSLHTIVWLYTAK